MSQTFPGLILPYKGIMPRIDKTAFIAPNAVVVGDVEIGADTGIWFNCALRGDINVIRVGARTNLQDGTIVHVNGRQFATHIGSDVTVGHMCLLHACTIEDGAFIGMQATVMDGAVIEKGAMVAAGALVTPGKRVKTGELWAGSPARFLRPVGDKEREMMTRIAPEYVELAREYMRAGVATKVDSASSPPRKGLLGDSPIPPGRGSSTS